MVTSPTQSSEGPILRHAWVVGHIRAQPSSSVGVVGGQTLPDVDPAGGEKQRQFKWY